MRIRGSVAAVAAFTALAVLTACGAVDQELSDPSEEPTTETPAVSPTPPAVAQEGDGHGCEDAAGDGATNDLLGVDLALDSETLTVTFDLSQPVPVTDTAMLGLNVMTETSDDPGYEMHQLGVKWLDGRMIGFFDFSFESGSQENLDYSGVTVTGNQVIAKWPASTIAELGPNWRWFAFATHEGTDTDACPGEPLSFETLTYQ